jgi:hypothetical protein
MQRPPQKDPLTCDEYHCQWDGEGEHTHIGAQPHLRRVMDHGKLIDGKTGREIGPGAELIRAITE